MAPSDELANEECDPPRRREISELFGLKEISPLRLKHRSVFETSVEMTINDILGTTSGNVFA